ncbi:MAG: hypothetical protein DI536_19805 [Archangium gephyra]|uniref:Uncharacterized protein n=1 Tax=Archangium gephyra TaxID=48 RepID=A0A2W5VJB7_9BACT|nr:MAG: hypothetical protein DI536_19805 [Archangium gephyra]
MVLAKTETGSAFFHRVLREAVGAFPTALETAKLPGNGKAFKAGYGDALSRFEAARIGSAQRLDIARHLQRATEASLGFSKGGTVTPLAEALKKEVAAPKTTTHEPTAKPGLRPEVPLDERIYRGGEVFEAIDTLERDHHLTKAAAKGLRWVVTKAEAQGGRLNLEGEKFALLGANAELSPVSLLLDAGATVRWFDVKAPSVSAGAGRIVATDGADDLLTNPLAAMAALREFAKDGPVHVGLFAYAPGASRELRLAGVMDAMVRALGPGVVKSVSMFISPTSPGEVEEEDLVAANARKANPKWWMKTAAMTGALKGPGSYGNVARGIISLQGAGYQAAQYLTKIIAAETLAADGLGGKPVTLSANVAGITNTRSLSHPLFQIAFQGAPSFGVRIFEPPLTRAVSGLLMLHDLLNPEAPGAATQSHGSPEARAKAVRTEQVHGHVYDLPWQFESCVKTAAVVGMGKNPGVLFKRGP